MPYIASKGLTKKKRNVKKGSTQSFGSSALRTWMKQLQRARTKGVSIMEANTEEQLINYMVALSPSIKINFVPLVDSSKVVEAYLKRKSVR